MSNRPLVYHWIAYYDDGIKLPQYNEECMENRFIDIDQERLVKFGLYPFSKELAKGVRKIGDDVVSIEILPSYEIELNKDKRLIYYRDVFISQEEFHICKKCKKEFKYTGIQKHLVKKGVGKYKDEYVPICPHCGAHDYYECKKCQRRFETFDDASQGMCPDCGREHGYLKRIVLTSGSYGREKKWIEYYLGYQILVKGINHKVIFKIKENGDCFIT